MKKTAAALLALLALAVGSAWAADPVRAGRVGIGAGLALGTSGSDAAAELYGAVEYNLWGHLSIGAGWTYVDGQHPLQVNATEVYAKGYLFGTPLDLFAAAALQLGVTSPVQVLGTLRVGGEWQSPWFVFVAVDAEALFEPAGVAWLFGGSIGVRF